ncbi:Zinc/iron permease [Parasitella parasitica]|nr:Zinc/iron permease [Parasitella parasitica]
MEPLTWLLLLGIAMLIGSYVAGSLPLSTKLSDRKIRILNSLGAGLLIGTSLMVVIPEGVETIYSSRARSATVISSKSSPKSGFAEIPNLSTLNTHKNWAAADNQDDQEDNLYKIVKKRSPKYEKEEEKKEEEGKEHVAVGLSLIIGFSLMFVIDQVSSLHMTAPNTSIEYSELNTVGGGGLQHEEEAIGPSTTTSSTNDESIFPDTHMTPVNRPSMTPTVGLVVHAAADGIALGASASHPQLSMVVFIAIMLHKAPASFALTSVLLASGLSHATIRKHLLLFALAAPLGALFTYFTLYFFSSSSTSASTLEYWTGVLLVFSGGTFLYVAMHALQEAAEASHHHGSGRPKAEQSQLFIILVGMATPIFLSMTHSH